MLVGVPLGLLVGALAWRVVADGLGAATSATVPLLGLPATAIGVLASVDLMAFVPGRRAACRRPAAMLRAE